MRVNLDFVGDELDMGSVGRPLVLHGDRCFIVEFGQLRTVLRPSHEIASAIILIHQAHQMEADSSLRL